MPKATKFSKQVDIYYKAMRLLCYMIKVARDDNDMGLEDELKKAKIQLARKFLNKVYIN